MVWMTIVLAEGDPHLTDVLRLPEGWVGPGLLYCSEVFETISVSKKEWSRINVF